MTTLKWFWSGVVVLSILGGLAFFGLTPFLQEVTNNNVQQLAGSSAGATFSTEKIASQVVSVSSSTVFSSLNGDASDRVISGAKVALRAGQSTTTDFTIGCATSTSPDAIGANHILDLLITDDNLDGFGSTTGSLYVGTTSPGLTGATTTVGNPGGPLPGRNNFARVWASGTYLNCRMTTANGSNSNLFSSTQTGTIGFPYLGQ